MSEFSMFKSIGRIILVILFVSASLNLARIPGTNSFFLDTEKTGVAVTAAILDMEIDSPLLVSATDILPGQSAPGSVEIKNEGDIDFQYKINFEKNSGSDELCSALDLTATKDGASFFSGPLSAISHGAGTLGAGDSDNWNFTVSLPAGASSDLGELRCDFSFEFSAWQTDLADPTSGFSDTEIMSGHELSSGDWTEEEIGEGDVIINEVMWMGSQKDSGTRYTADEWIELRNATGHDINIKNWNIFGITNGGHFEISGGDSVWIPAGGYYLISDKDKDDSRIDVSPDTTSNNINIDDNYSSNGRIILKDKDGNIIDQTPSPDGNDWPAGKDESHKRWSMERNTRGHEWHTCDPEYMTADEIDEMKSYWDADARDYNCGTPGHDNLSSNDPTAEDYEGEIIEADAALTPDPVIGVLIEAPMEVSLPPESLGAGSFPVATEEGGTGDEKGSAPPDEDAVLPSDTELVEEPPSTGEDDTATQGGETPEEEVLAEEPKKEEADKDETPKEEIPEEEVKEEEVKNDSEEDEKAGENEKEGSEPDEKKDDGKEEEKKAAADAKEEEGKQDTKPDETKSNE